MRLWVLEANEWARRFYAKVDYTGWSHEMPSNRGCRVVELSEIRYKKNL